MSELPAIAVLVLNYNGQRYLARCFTSLREQTYTERTVYLIDNGSSDGSIGLTREHFPEVRIIAFPRNIGFTLGYNRAVEAVDEPLIVFLNNDTACAPDWLEKLYGPMCDMPRVAAVGSRMVFAHDPTIINHGGGYFTYTGIGLDRDFGKSIHTPDLPRGPFQTAYACGGAALVRKDAFEEVGGFGSEYFIYFEDVDLCYRLWLAGYQVMHAPESLVVHYFSPVFGQESPAKLFLCQKNRLSNLLKHFSRRTFLKSLIISTGYDLRRMCLWLRNGHYRLIRALLRGYLHFVIHLPQLVMERSTVQADRVRLEQWLLKRGLMLDLASSYTELKRLQTIKAGLFRQA